MTDESSEKEVLVRPAAAFHEVRIMRFLEAYPRFRRKELGCDDASPRYGSEHEWVPGQRWDLIVTMDDAISEAF